MKVYVANDTSSSSHAGCIAVMRSLRAAILGVPGARIIGTQDFDAAPLDYNLLSDADVVFVNGEGTIHHSGPRAIALLRMIGVAKSLGKRVILANALFQQYECEDPRILDGLNLLAVREPRSAAFARRFGGNPITLLDSAADPQFLRFGNAIPGLSGRLVGSFHNKGLLYDPFAEVKGHRLTMRSGSFEDIVATLRNADVYLTAQHHGVYAAAIAGCPFVASPSNSHKIESFLDWMGFPVPICMRLDEVDAALRFAIRNRSMYVELADYIRTLPVLTTKNLVDAI